MEKDQELAENVAIVNQGNKMNKFNERAEEILNEEVDYKDMYTMPVVNKAFRQVHDPLEPKKILGLYVAKHGGPKEKKLLAGIVKDLNTLADNMLQILFN